MQQENPVGLRPHRLAAAERLSPIPVHGNSLAPPTMAHGIVAKAAGVAWLGEPSLCDLLGDPITRALMIADRVTRQDVDLLMATAASQRRR